jgi:uncharacterized protein
MIEEVEKLFEACTKGLSEEVASLIGAGVDVNSRDGGGDTPLIMAAAYGKTMIVKFLLLKGADPSLVGMQGMTALYCAVEREDYAAFDALLDRGAPVNVAYSGNGFTPLLLACEQGFEEMAVRLIAAGADVNAASKNGRTPLMFVAYKNPRVARLLLDKGADIHAVDDMGRTALYEACGAGIAEIVELLLDRGADTKAADLDGSTALHEAARSGDADIVRMLAAKGADLDAVDEAGFTPYARVEEGDKEMAALLLELGAKGRA